MQTLTYDTVNGLDLDLYNAPTSGARPVVMFVHGGSWTGGDKIQGEKLEALCVAEGFALASIEYRKIPSVGLEDMVTDIRNAAAYLGANATTLKLGMLRTAAIGFSAGAHLAALAILRGDLGPTLPATARPDAFVGIDGFGYDVPAIMASTMTTAQRAAMEAVFGTDSTKWPSYSPKDLAGSVFTPTTTMPWHLVHALDTALAQDIQSISTVGFHNHLDGTLGFPGSIINLSVPPDPVIPHDDVMDEFDDPTSDLYLYVRDILRTI